MDKECNELMQITKITEDTNLTEMIKDIMPINKVRFTDLELEVANKRNEEFSLVIYKKQNPLSKFFKGIIFTLEKIRIMKHSKEFSLYKINNK